MSIVLVLAMADNGVIGRGGVIPWHISADLKRFRALTLGHTIVMGRKTWDSLPRKPLPERKNVVLTRNVDWSAPGALRASPAEIDASHITSGEDVMVIGGAEIYRHFLSFTARIELTEVHGDFEGDAFFYFDRDQWREIAREDHIDADGLGYSFVTLVRATR